MGQCLCTCSQIEYVTKIALKLPNGLNGIKYDETTQTFIECNIQIWISELYKNSSWTNWIVYNDQNHLKKVKKGHCKGIVAWNNTHVSWLCHSVPKFPLEFTGSTISEIDKSELIYGQSFHYYECLLKKDLISSILQQLYIMDVCPIIQQYTGIQKFDTEIDIVKSISTLELDDNMVHIAKSPSYEVDIYSQYLVNNYPAQWNVETWIRGHLITSPSPLLKDIDIIFFKDHQYKESQDHSKWAVSDKDWYLVGDLNRMTSQFHRGGGGFLGKDKYIANAFLSLIKKTKLKIQT